MPTTATCVVTVDCREEPIRKELGAGLLVLSRFLGYRERVFVLSPLWREADDTGHRVALIRLRFVGKNAITCIALHETDSEFYRLQFCRVVEATDGLARLQCWFIRRRQGRHLAVCMALHARLGAGSPLALLDADVVLALLLLGNGVTTPHDCI